MSFDALARREDVPQSARTHYYKMSVVFKSQRQTQVSGETVRQRLGLKTMCITAQQIKVEDIELILETKWP